MVNEKPGLPPPLPPEYPRERHAHSSGLWFLVAPSIVIAWVVLALCFLVSAVAVTVWLVRQAFGV